MNTEVTKIYKEEVGSGIITHMVDTRGNYFIDGKCQNPKSYEDAEIGDNIPDFPWTEHPTDVANNINSNLQ